MAKKRTAPKKPKPSALSRQLLGHIALAFFQQMVEQDVELSVTTAWFGPMHIYPFFEVANCDTQNGQTWAIRAIAEEGGIAIHDFVRDDDDEDGSWDDYSEFITISYERADIVTAVCAEMAKRVDALINRALISGD
jgi:hypothetical protein